MSSIVPPKKLTVADQARLKIENVKKTTRAAGMTMVVVGAFLAAACFCIIMFFFIRVVVIPALDEVGSEELEPPAAEKKMSKEEKDKLKNEQTFLIATTVFETGMYCALFFFVMLGQIVVMVGGSNLINLKSKKWVYAGIIVCFVPGLSPAGVLGIPLGIWALTIVSRPDVDKAFA